MHLYPLTTATIARPIPVLPEVPSMIVPPGLSSPAFSASSIIFTAMRSLIELPGLNVSIFASTVASISPRVIRLMRTIGVSPIASRIVSQIFFFTTVESMVPSLSPHAEGAAHGDELADVIRVVVDHQHELAQIRLTRSVRDRREQVEPSIGRERFQRVPIASECGDALVPGSGVGRRVGLRPVIVRPFRLDVLRVAAELEDVELRQAQMLEELPQRVRHPLRLSTARVRRDPIDRPFEVDVGVMPFEGLRDQRRERRTGSGRRGFPCALCSLSVLSAF